MNTQVNHTVADRGYKIALIMGTGGASADEACRALDESGGDVDRAMAQLYGDTKKATGRETKTRSKKSMPSHRYGQHDDVDDSIEKPSEKRHESLRYTPALLRSSRPRNGARKEKDDQEDGDNEAAEQAKSSSSETHSYSAFNIAENPNPPVAAPRVVQTPPPVLSGADPNHVSSETDSYSVNVAENPSPLVVPRVAPAPLPVAPGAVAVEGPEANHFQEEEYTLTPPTEVPSTPTAPVNPMEPVTARIICDTDQDVEVLEDQIRRQGEELKQMHREQDNAAVGQVIDLEAQGSLPTGKRCMQNLRGSRSKWAVIVAVILAITGAVLGVVLFDSSGKMAAPNPTTAAMTTTTTTTNPPPPLVDLLSSVSLDGGAALQTPSTPQNDAYNWLRGNANLESYSSQKRIQRYVLATFYYSTKGNAWKRSDGWMSDDDECTWYNKAESEPCTSDGDFSELDFFASSTGGNNLVGTVPVELALLSNSLNRLQFGRNGLMGTIPSEIGLLSYLDELLLAKNNFKGSIPSEIGLLMYLSGLILQFNSLIGTIPSKLLLFPTLKSLYLFSNCLMGTIPSKIGLLASLDTLRLYGNDWSGEFTCPTSFVSVSSPALTQMIRLVVPFSTF